MGGGVKKVVQDLKIKPDISTNNLYLKKSHDINSEQPLKLWWYMNIDCMQYDGTCTMFLLSCKRLQWLFIEKKIFFFRNQEIFTSGEAHLMEVFFRDFDKKIKSLFFFFILLNLLIWFLWKPLITQSFKNSFSTINLNSFDRQIKFQRLD